MHLIIWFFFFFGLFNSFIYIQVTLKTEQMVLPLVDENLQQTTVKGVAYQHPEIVANIELVMQDLHSEPVYWKLPEQFGGKKVKISFFWILANADILQMFSLVLLQKL